MPIPTRRTRKFYAFYRSLNAYRTSLGAGDSTLVLAPDSAFFQFFGNMHGAPEASSAPSEPPQASGPIPMPMPGYSSRMRRPRSPPGPSLAPAMPKRGRFLVKTPTLSARFPTGIRHYSRHLQ